MPSPIQKQGKVKFYKRKDGAWIKHGSGFLKVGAKKYRNRTHYSMHVISSDRKRHSKRKVKRKVGRRYPQAYDY